MAKTDSTKTGRRLIYYLSLIGFFAIFSTTISKNPVLPLFAKSLGSDAALIGAIAAFSPLAGMLFSFPVGVLSDRLGRKKLLLASSLVFLTAPLFYLFVQDPLYLIPIRFFHGFSTAILMPVISTIIVERYAGRKGEMLGWYSSATMVGRMMAPLAGGAILGYFAASPGLAKYHLVYLAAFAASIPLFIMVLFYRDRDHGKPHARASFKKSLVVFFSDARLRSTALVQMATYFAFGAFETYMPLLMQMKGLTAYDVGAVFSVQVFAIALTKPLFGRLSDRTDRRAQILSGLLLMGASLAALPLFSGMLEFMALSVLTGLGLSLSTVAGGAYIADVAKKGELGASMGAASSVMDIGHTFGPMATGMLIASFGYTAGFMSSFLLALVVGVFFAVSVRRR